MVSRSRSILVPLSVFVGLLTLPLSAQAQLGGTAPFGETIRSFVTTAYQQVGLSPTCSAITAEDNALLNRLPTNSPQFEAEARRFVSTLIETQASYDTPQPYFEETPAYSARNPIPPPTTHQGTQAFVIDLYHAFLQRDPDFNGLFYWTDRADSYSSPGEGRRAVLDAFGIIPDDAEFSDLVHSLTPDRCATGHYDCICDTCIPRCPRGSAWDSSSCSCSFL